MARAANDILAAIAQVLNGQPEVFSTAQWGGRAYKLPGPNGSLKRPKLLAFVSAADDGEAVHVTFKLEKRRAADVIRALDWIVREPFGSLGNAGWVLARVRTRTQFKRLAALLAECRSLHPIRDTSSEALSTPRHDLQRLDANGATSDPVARRIDRVMLEVKSNGWSPRDDAFDHSDSTVRTPGRRARRAPQGVRARAR